VPADLGTELAAELEPLFAQLEPTERECAAILAQGRRDASAIRADAQARAKSVALAAAGQVDSERATAAAAVRHRTEADSEAALGTAQREAEELRRRATERMPGCVDRIVAAVSILIGDERTTVEPPGGSA
jgi:hypothetical protein